MDSGQAPPGPNDPVEQHQPRFTFTRQALVNLASTCSTGWIVEELHLAERILSRARDDDHHIRCDTAPATR